jgi:hypothetical protein
VTLLLIFVYSRLFTFYNFFYDVLRNLQSYLTSRDSATPQIHHPDKSNVEVTLETIRDTGNQTISIGVWKNPACDPCDQNNQHNFTVCDIKAFLLHLPVFVGDNETLSVTQFRQLLRNCAYCTSSPYFAVRISHTRGQEDMVAQALECLGYRHLTVHFLVTDTDVCKSAVQMATVAYFSSLWQNGEDFDLPYDFLNDKSKLFSGTYIPYIFFFLVH